jgi:hypothetical protein
LSVSSRAASLSLHNSASVAVSRSFSGVIAADQRPALFPPSTPPSPTSRLIGRDALSSHPSGGGEGTWHRFIAAGIPRRCGRMRVERDPHSLIQRSIRREFPPTAPPCPDQQQCSRARSSNVLRGRGAWVPCWPRAPEYVYDPYPPWGPAGGAAVESPTLPSHAPKVRAH